MQQENIILFPGQYPEGTVNKGFGRVPHTVATKIAQTNFNAYESRAARGLELMTFHQDGATHCKVNLARLVAITKLDRRHAGRAVQSLLDRHILIEQDGQWTFNPNLDQWADKGREKKPRLKIVPNKAQDAGVPNEAQKSVPNEAHSTVPNEAHCLYGSSTSLDLEIDKRKNTKKEKMRRAAENPLGFDAVWLAYPKKKSEGQARKTWAKLNPSAELVEDMLAAIELWKKQPDWLKDRGMWIPHLSTWLNAEGWKDRPDVELPDLEYTDRQRTVLQVFNETCTVADRVKLESFIADRAFKIDDLYLRGQTKGHPVDLPDFWKTVFTQVNQGVPKLLRNGRSDFDWIMAHENMTRILEAAKGRGRV